MRELNDEVTIDKPQMQHIRGFDTLRFCLALWVVFSHFGFFPLVDGIDKTQFLGKLISGLFNNIVSGPAAVIVFFVISGVCIHFPYRGQKKLAVFPYFTRRYIRIVTPMLAAILLARPLGIELTLLSNSILWSLLAEEIYYALYPLLLLAQRRIGWGPIILTAYVLAVIVIIRGPVTGEYIAYGPYLNWMVGLPCWLLGCYLAEHLESVWKLAPSRRRITGWRLGMWLLSSLCSVLRFHSPIKYPWTLTLFAVVVYFWLRQEIAYYRSHNPPAALEKAGKWSYSIYLFHMHAYAIYVLLVPLYFGPTLNWAICMSFILLACYAFYRVVEKPSHAIARRVAGLRMRSAPRAEVMMPMVFDRNAK
jgi:peptidoglycan/LPS O-acetylase OafA/YrhL